MNTPRRISYAYLGVIAIWSTTPLGIQWSTLGSSYAFAVMMRMLIGWAICLAALRIARWPLPMDINARKLYAVTGLSMFSAMLCTYWGAQHIPSGLISVIFGLSPFMYASIVAFGIVYARQPVQFFGVLPLTGRQLMYGFIGFVDEAKMRPPPPVAKSVVLP